MRTKTLVGLAVAAALAVGGGAWAFTGSSTAGQGGEPVVVRPDAAGAGCCVTGDCCCPGQGSCCDLSKRATADVAKTLKKAASCCSTGNCCCPGAGSCCAATEATADVMACCTKAATKAACCTE